MTVLGLVKESFAQCKIGEEYDTKAIKSIVNSKHGTNMNSVIPSDYCYNITNEGIDNYIDYLHIFEQIKRGRYKYLGEKYPYTGKVHKKGLPIGEWINGIYYPLGKFEKSKYGFNKQTKVDVNVHSLKVIVYSDPRIEFLRLSKVEGRNIDEQIKNSVKRAYGDFQRTLIGFGSVENKSKLKSNAENLLYEAICSFLKSDTSDFNTWHRDLLFKLKETFLFRQFTVGQAQKWINMSLKYLYCFTADAQSGLVKETFSQCHTPIDRYVMKNASSWHDIKPLPVVWSKLNDYKMYLDYQSSLKSIADKKGITQLELDFELWKS